MKEFIRSSSDGLNPKRKFNGSHRKETEEYKIRIITQDKQIAVKLNFGQSGQSESQLIVIEINDEGLVDVDLKHHESTN